MNDQSMRKVVFLDTNILHFVDLYLTQAKNHSLFPLTGSIADARQNLSDMSDENLGENLQKGLNVIDNLLAEPCSVEYSPASEIELMVGRLHGKAILNAALEGIPDRVWTRFREKEISRRLEGADLLSIQTRVADISERLNEVGIDVTVTDGRRTNDVLDLAKNILGLVYLSTLDSVIYASALVAEADHVISNDSYFKHTINRINTDGRQRFRNARNGLQARVAEVALRDPQVVKLPDAPNWSGSGR